MSTEHVKIYEEKTGFSIWFLILPLVVVAGSIAFFLHHHRGAAPVPAGTDSGLPAVGSVHFVTSGTELDADGLATVDRAAEALRGNPNVGFKLEGYAATADALTRGRDLAVTQALEARGIDPSRMVVAPFPPPTPADTDPVPDKAPDTLRAALYLK